MDIADYNFSFLYWFKRHWLHEVYSAGLEDFVRKYLNGQRVETNVDQRELMAYLQSKAYFFYWVPVVNHGISHQSGLLSQDIIGQRLIAKELDGQDLTFRKIIEVRKCEHDGKFRLYACKDFKTGDAITFVSQLEENTGSVVFGGTCARIVDSTNESNSYLGSNRLLRCIKPISEGEEITREQTNREANDRFDNIDRVVISRRRMIIGTIGSQYLNGGVKIHYVDGSTESTTLESESALLVYQS